MRLLAVHSIYSDSGHHVPGSEFELVDLEEAARLVQIGAAFCVESNFDLEPETAPVSTKTKKGPHAKS
jgi:hypothetical protein